MGLSGGTGPSAKSRRQKTGRSKPHKKVTAATRDCEPSVAELQDELNVLRRELTESLQQQTATADVLKVISRSPTDAQPVFDMIAQSAARLCGAQFCHVFHFDGELIHFVAHHGLPPERLEILRRTYPIPPGRRSATARAILNRDIEQIADVQADPDYEGKRVADSALIRSFLSVPMLKGGSPVGAITLARTQAGNFPARQIELLKTFADQAVIAIENARLFEAEQQRTRELTEALERQTATAEVLNVISRSTFQLQPVLDTIVQTASRLCNAETALIFMLREEKLHLVATNNASDAFVQYALEHPLLPERGSITGRTFLERTTVHLPDCLADSEYTLRDWQAIGQYRSMLGVPLLREGSPIGVITVWRTFVLPFTGTEIDLIKTFADQAVIAIENVRLFDELQARTDELSESLQQQTATADVLKVISHSTFDLQTVLDELVESATRLCNADHTWLFQREDEYFRWVASFGLATDVHARIRDFLTTTPVQVNRGSITGRVALEARAIHVPDVLADPEYTYSVAQNTQKIGGYRAALGVPLSRQGEVVGVLFIAKTVPQPFTEKQIELATTFADQAVIAIENTRLLNELRESLQQQTATADVLKVISRSTFDLQAVLDTLVKSAVQLCDADQGHIASPNESGFFQTQAHFGFSTGLKEEIERVPFKPGRDSITARALLECTTVQIVDAQNDPEYKLSEAQRVGGYRSMIGTPLLREGTPIGVFGLARQAVRPFTDKQMALLTTFADQAVIAIENVRLFEAERQRTQELTESLQQQTATAEVLKVISRSAFDLQTVLDTLMESAARLCDADHAWLFEREDEGLRWVASFGHAVEVHEQIKAHFQTLLVPLGRGSVTGRATLEGTVIHVPDVLADPGYVWSGALKAQQIGNYRAALGVPLLRQGQVVGVIFVTKTVPQPFTTKQIEVVTTFADQAVIAIENTRLLNELRESLQQQTATADVLKVISRSTFDLQTVLDTLVTSAVELCEADQGMIARPNERGFFQTQAHFGHSTELEEELDRIPFKPGRDSLTGRVLLERATVQIVDAQSDPEYKLHKAQRLGGNRSMIGTPLLREGAPIGVFTMARRSVRPFTDKQMALLTTFADQAVIAIENARLFDEVRTRTDELSESLRQQTATADVLQVISGSAFDLQPVFDTVAESSVKLCEAERAVIHRYDGELLRIVASFNSPPELKEWLVQHPIRPGRHSASARAALERRTVHIPDCHSDPEYSFGAQDIEPVRTVLAVPILKGDGLLGVVVIYRFEVRPFTDKQITLIETFADQSAIAIENTRLFEEVQQRTEALTESLRQQTATADVLKVISRSAFDLPTVLRTLVESAAQLCEADQANIIRQKGSSFYVTEACGYSQEFMQAVKDLPIEPTWGLASGRALLEGHIVHIPDVEADPDYTFTAKSLGDYRTILAVPMLREGEAIGVLVLTRSDVRPFTDKQIETAQTFADQAAIAIENVRLFDSVEARTRELAASLEELRTAQDRLVQTEKLASLGQLTAGIAHEIKNPLNFVNNFSSLAIELIDELEEALQAARLDGKVNAQIAELADMLKGNLGKVVEHGKRADSIVKNMLLHSRQGAGEHRQVEINSLVVESLNLAYHGARAAKQGFNITLEQSLDPAAGIVDVFPQEITRVLLNLISNGFYAAAKRKAETVSGTYEPTLTVSTRSLGDGVEIRIRDNGTGIPAEVKEKMFNPFFTTKPAGEGTGLGLSLSHDIIVKQHGGSIKVDTEPGEFTEFTIVLPRVAASIANSGERR